MCALRQPLNINKKNKIKKIISNATKAKPIFLSLSLFHTHREKSSHGIYRNPPLRPYKSTHQSMSDNREDELHSHHEHYRDARLPRQFDFGFTHHHHEHQQQQQQRVSEAAAMDLYGFDGLSGYMSFTDCLRGSAADYGTLSRAFDMSCSPSSEVLLPPVEKMKSPDMSESSHQGGGGGVGSTTTPVTTPNSSVSSSSTEAVNEEEEGRSRKDRAVRGGEDGCDKSKNKEQAEEEGREEGEGASIRLHDEERGRPPRGWVPLEEVRSEGSQEQPLSKKLLPMH
ncbi:hypothetical protein QJS10_CPB14g00507 [Acorus calamus]|uniref:Uncharacterized protein n=1 Tax=Acorus calamus TaxID=4465 RepID=A0AAV9DDG4_ACOCL|nr:hypothetical protein QJS10_CPB14g00507 [Acorus calamus]